MSDESRKVADATRALLAEVAALVESHPDLVREHFDGEACDDHACRIVTAARRLEDALHGNHPDYRRDWKP